MTTNPPTLKRTLFGYRPDTVRQLLLGRETMFSRAQQRLRQREEELQVARAELQEVRGHLERAAEGAGSADQENARLRRELEKALAELRDRVDSEPGASSAEIEAIRAQLTKQAEATRAAEARANQLEAETRSLREELQRREGTPPPAGPSATQELSSVLDMVEQNLHRILDQARTRNQAQLEEVASVRRELDERIERFSAWRDHVVAQVRSVRDAVVSARTHAQQVPERLRAALAPTAEAMTSANDTLAEFIRATEGSEDQRSDGGPAEAASQPSAHVQPPTGSAPRPEEANEEGLPRDFGLQ